MPTKGLHSQYRGRAFLSSLERHRQPHRITQATIQAGITDLVQSEDWGNPRGYDITINRKGEKLNTEYTVQPSPHKPLDEKIRAEFESKKLNLDALFEGGAPFAAASTVADQAADAEFAAVTKEDVPSEQPH